jgi:hypothetical protein
VGEAGLWFEDLQMRGLLVAERSINRSQRTQYGKIGPHGIARPAQAVVVEPIGCEAYIFRDS